MKRKEVLLVGIFIFFYTLISFSSAQNSSAKTEFTILGCSGGIPVGCSGNHYCDLFGGLKDTRIDNYKCMLYAGCCSDSYYCACPNGGSCSDDSKRCISRNSRCEDLGLKTDCEDQNCIWMNGQCYDPSSLQSCSSYTTKTSCQNDTKNLGKTGAGSEICIGGVFVGADKVVDPTSCKCFWNSTGNKCQISYTTIQRNSAVNPDFFECRKDISVSSCNDGLQTVSWKATVAKTSGYIPSDQERQDAGCVDSSKIVPCGEEVSLLPGFTFFNLILVGGLLFGFYFLRNKKIFLFLIFGIFLFSSFALAGTCAPSQQIYRLYEENDSHVQLSTFGETYGKYNCTNVWEDSGINCTSLNGTFCEGATSNGQKICQWISSPNQIYSYDVCYNEIFGTNYTGSNPHPETCDKPLFWVAKVTNSHVALNNRYTYDIPVCYGDLKCTNRSVFVGCRTSDGERQVGLVYSRAYNESNLHVSFKYPQTIFGEVICCKSGGLNESYWSDFNDNRIAVANNKQKVKMVAAGSGLQNQVITYTVWKSIPFWWDNQIAKKDTYGANVFNFNGLEAGTYYFTSKIGTNGRLFQSGNLIVSNCNPNTMECNIEPNISIISPECGDEFFKEDSANVAIRISDPDDPLEGNLSFSDTGEVISVNNLYSGSNGQLSYNHNFTIPGTVKIVLDVNGISKGIERRFRRSINLIVIDESVEKNYIAACIQEPEDLSFIPSSWVRFNAQTTRALSFTFDDDIQEIVKDNIYFKWLFSDSTEYEGCGSDPSVYSFNHQFADSGNNWADLDVSLDGGCSW